MSTTANRIIKNAGWLYAKMGITMFISLYTTRLILNTLGASDFGIFNIVGGAIGMLGFLNAAMASATVRYMAFAEGSGDTEKKIYIFNNSFILHFAIALLLSILLFVAGMILFDGVLNIPENRLFAAKVVYASLIVSTLLTVVNVPYEAVMNSHENMKYYSFVGILECLLKLVVAYFCVFTSYDKLIIYGLLMSAIPLITLTIMKIYCHKRYNECVFSPRKYFNKKNIADLTSFAGWNLFATAAAMITNSGVGIVMNMFFGTVINAAQGVANQICGQLMALTSVLSKAITPVITKSEGAMDRKRTIILAETSCKLMFFAMAMLAIPALSTLPTLMKLWLKDVPEFAVYFASIQLLIHMCEQLTSGFGTAIVATGNIKGMSISRAIFKLSYLPLSYILFKLNISVTIVYFILLILQGVINSIIITQYYGYKILGYSPVEYLRNVFIPSTLSSLLAFIAGISISSFFDGISSLAIALVVCSVINLITFYYITLSVNERKIVNGILQTVKNRLHI